MCFFRYFLKKSKNFRKYLASEGNISITKLRKNENDEFVNGLIQPLTK